MQPAKINWKTKSRIDCWGGAAKTQPPVAQQLKREIASPAQRGPEKTLIEQQQELEQSLPKFSENKPGNVSNNKQQAAIVDNILDDSEFNDCETVPNEQSNQAMDE